MKVITLSQPALTNVSVNANEPHLSRIIAITTQKPKSLKLLKMAKSRKSRASNITYGALDSSFKTFDIFISFR